MGWKFYGHAAVFGYPDDQGDVFCPGAFSEFLHKADFLSIPMLNAHEPSQQIGRWLHMHQDVFGLFVIGELVEQGPLPGPPWPGLSIKPIRTKGSSYRNPVGGALCRITWIEEISLVLQPANPACRIV